MTHLSSSAVILSAMIFALADTRSLQLRSPSSARGPILRFYDSKQLQNQSLLLAEWQWLTCQLKAAALLAEVQQCNKPGMGEQNEKLHIVPWPTREKAGDALTKPQALAFRLLE